MLIVCVQLYTGTEYQCALFACYPAIIINIVKDNWCSILGRDCVQFVPGSLCLVIANSLELTPTVHNIINIYSLWSALTVVACGVVSLPCFYCVPTLFFILSYFYPDSFVLFECILC